MKTALPSPFKYTVLAFALAAGLVAASISRADSPGVTSEQRQVAAFQSIEISGPYRIVIRAQGQPSLELKGESKGIAQIETRVSGDTLIVRPAPGYRPLFNFGREDKVTITITTAMLKSLKTSGSGDVELDQVNSDQLNISASGPGDLTGAGGVRELVLNSSGPGDVDLRRLKAVNVKLNMSGPGDVLLSGLLNRLDGEIDGPGDLSVARLQAQSVRLLMTGPGDVSLDGETLTLAAELRGSGTLEAPRLNAKNATVRSRGPGDIALATISDTLDADLRGPGSLDAVMAGKRLVLNISGPGDAHIKGTVDTVNAQLSGPGDLEARGLVAGSADVVVRGPGSAVVGVKPKAETAMHLLMVDRSGSRQARE